MYKYFLTFMFLSSFFGACKQGRLHDADQQKSETKSSIAELQQLSREELIQLALKRIKPEPSLKLFDTTVYNVVHVKTDGKHIKVTFSLPVRYLAQGDNYYSDITVFLADERLALRYARIRNDKKEKYVPVMECFVPTEESKKVTDQIVKVMNYKVENGPLTICDEGDKYKIEVGDYDTAVGFYSFYKKTGKLTSEGHIHGDPSPEEKKWRFITN